jgi:hypothetical protein
MRGRIAIAAIVKGLTTIAVDPHACHRLIIPPKLGSHETAAFLSSLGVYACSIRRIRQRRVSQDHPIPYITIRLVDYRSIRPTPCITT